MSGPKFVFMTRIRDLASNVFVCEAYKGNAAKQNVSDNIADWHEIFRGTREECDNYTTNLHHSIDPKMAETTGSKPGGWNPRRDVRRRI